MIIALWGATAAAWDGIGAVWAPESMPIPYEIHADLGYLDDAAAVAAIQAGFQVWEAEDCGVSFTYVGRADDVAFGGDPDGRNVVFFITEDWPSNEALLTEETIGLDGNDIVEGDIAFNAEKFAWTLEDADGLTIFDLQGAAAHEAGHIIGLTHSSVIGATSNPLHKGDPITRDLHEDDIDGLCTLYTPTPLGGQGDACVEHDDCGGELMCLADAGAEYCAAPCDGPADCGEGTTCATIEEGGAFCAQELIVERGCGCESARVWWPLAWWPRRISGHT